MNLIAATTTRAGLSVRARLDSGFYPKGIKVANANKELDAIPIVGDKFHGEWNYKIAPR